MDLIEFKTTISSCISEATTLKDNTSTAEQSLALETFIQSLQTLSSFLENERNISVLTNYLRKADLEQDSSPLDALCRDVISKFEEINDLLINQTLNSLQSDIAMFSNGLRTRILKTSESSSLIISMLRNASFSKLLSAFEVLNHLEGHNKTLIILGPNGSGKTSFANHLTKLDAHVKVIPASKPIKTAGYISSIYNSTLETYNSELYSGKILQEDLLQKLIIGLCTEHDDIARKYLETDIKERKTTYEKIKEVFDEFFDVKLDNSAFSSKEMKAKKADGAPFPFNSMSDGERAAFFYISTVVAAPNQSFIVVDEPENHLNPAIYNKIWDRLIEIRTDCQFIFISHTMDFISARSNYELVKIKSFVHPNCILRCPTAADAELNGRGAA